MTSAARRTSRTPMKVYEATRIQARYAAALKDTTQAEIVETAMNEYIERHAEEFALGLKHAREALSAGPVATAAYLLDEDIEDQDDPGSRWSWDHNIRRMALDEAYPSAFERADILNRIKDNPTRQHVSNLIDMVDYLRGRLPGKVGYGPTISEQRGRSITPDTPG
ncbi:MAG: hypothetical protein ACR2L3_03670 [Actinomycetota bacterium]